MLPLSFVEGEGFYDLMAFVEIVFKPPLWQTTANSWTALTIELCVTKMRHFVQNWEDQGLDIHV